MSSDKGISFGRGKNVLLKNFIDGRRANVGIDDKVKLRKFPSRSGDNIKQQIATYSIVHSVIPKSLRRINRFLMSIRNLDCMLPIIRVKKYEKNIFYHSRNEYKRFGYKTGYIKAFKQFGLSLNDIVKTIPSIENVSFNRTPCSSIANEERKVSSLIKRFYNIHNYTRRANTRLLKLSLYNANNRFEKIKIVKDIHLGSGRSDSVPTILLRTYRGLHGKLMDNPVEYVNKLGILKRVCFIIIYTLFYGQRIEYNKNNSRFKFLDSIYTLLSKSTLLYKSGVTMRYYSFVHHNSDLITTNNYFYEMFDKVRSGASGIISRASRVNYGLDSRVRLSYGKSKAFFRNTIFHNDAIFQGVLGLMDSEISFTCSRNQYFFLLKILYSRIKDFAMIEKFDLVCNKIHLLAFAPSGQIIMKRWLNRRGKGAKNIKCMRIFSEKIMSNSSILNYYQHSQNLLLDQILKDPSMENRLNYQRTLVSVLKGFENGPHYKYKSFKLFRIRIRKFFHRRRMNAFLSSINQDWIGPIVTRRSRELRVAKQTRSILYENLRYFYGLLKIGSIWEWVKSYRGKVTRAFKIETFLKYYELNLELLLYRSGFIPTRNLAKAYVRAKDVCVNGKIVDDSKFRISNLDIIGSSSKARVWAKFTYMKYLQSILYSKKSGLLAFASKFLETNYSIFGSIYISQLFKAKYIPITDFKFREYDRNRLVYRGKYDVGRRHRSKMVW